MAKEWKQTCKDCGTEFGYSDTSLQRDVKKGQSRPERCQKCRGTHSQAIKTIAASHFALKPRHTKASILGYPFLGEIDHGDRKVAEPNYVEPNMAGVDIGLKESHIHQVYDALRDNQVVVVVAPTGSGKSTYIPSKLLYPLPPKETNYFTNRGPIIITQPRIAATIQIPNSIGKKFGGCSVGSGFDIGYCYSKDKENYDLKRNRMVFTTDGSLINWIADGKIGEFSMIVIDEAHERSYNIESIINMVYRELLKYPELKVMIISATIDASSFKNFFSKTTKVHVLDFSDCEKTFGYESLDKWGWDDLKQNDFDEKIYQENKSAGELFLNRYKSNIASRLAAEIIAIVKKSNKGSVLGFLDGKENINVAIEKIRDVFNDTETIRVYPFHRDLSDKEMNEVLNPKFKGRRIIIATNSAETSLTVQDLVYVVDSGLIKEESWNSSTCRKGLDTKFHSKAGCRQRWGRAGRVQKGFVAKLYSQDEFIKYFPNYTIPAIQRSNAEPLILDAIASGQSDMEKYEMLTKPDKTEWERALSVIKERELLDSDGDFTTYGLEIYELSKTVGYVLGNSKAEYNSTDRSLDVACLLILADKYACLIEAATIICMMPHMGNSLYWSEDGLFKWNKNGNLVSKDYHIRLLDSLRAGCIDDLDFACKLFSIFEGNFFHEELPAGYRNWFVKEYALNEKCFAAIVEIRSNLLGKFTEGKKTDEYRKLDLNLLTRVRVLASIAWGNRLVSIKKEEELAFENIKDKSFGIISNNSAGNWINEKNAIIGLLDQNLVFATFDKKRQKVPVANFLIKYLSPVPKNNVIDILSSFRKHSEERKIDNAYSNLIYDLSVPVNRRLKLDEGSKKVISSFLLQQSNAHSESNQDLFIAIDHQQLPANSTYEFAVQFDSHFKNTNDFLIEKWINIKGNPIAILNKLPLSTIAHFEKYKVGDTVSATIMRPVANVKGIGVKEIVGYIVDIEGFHYSLPIENTFIDYENDFLEKLIGEKVTLSKVGVTPNSKQPIFSRTSQIEKERENILKLGEVVGKIVKRSSQEVSCQIQDGKLQFPHFVKIFIGKMTDDKRLLQINGEVKIKLNDTTQEEIITVDCVNDSIFDLTDEDKQNIRTFLLQIKSDNAKYSSFINCGIEINRTKLSISKRLLFDHFIMLSFAFPVLKNAFKFLHEKSWEISGEIQSIQKKIDNEVKRREAKSKLENDLSNARISYLKLFENEKKLHEMLTNARSEARRAEVNVWIAENSAKLRQKYTFINNIENRLKNQSD